MAEAGARPDRVAWLIASSWLALPGIIGTLTGGCATGAAEVPLAPLPMLSAFDAQEAAYIDVPGPNAVQGQAFLRQQGGGVVTCAGETVWLVPDTAYARERIRKAYGSEALEAPARRIIGVILENPVTAYVAQQRQTTCDRDGQFSFTELADGTYYIETEVRWMVGLRPQGGPVIAPVVLRGGQSVDVIVAPR